MDCCKKKPWKQRNIQRQKFYKGWKQNKQLLQKLKILKQKKSPLQKFKKKTKKQRNRHGKNFTKVENKTKIHVLQKLKLLKKITVTIFFNTRRTKNIKMQT